MDNYEEENLNDEPVAGESVEEADEEIFFEEITVERVSIDEVEFADELDGPGAEEEVTAAAAEAEAESAGQDPAGEGTAAEPPSSGRETAAIARDIEAVLFISSEPVTLEVLAEVTGAEGEELAHAVEAVRGKYSDTEGGISFAAVAGGYTFRTGDLAREAVERFCRRPIDYSLSPAAMETLAIIAYMQPITRPEVARIRGVGADTVVANLLDKGLVEEAGRNKQTGAVKYRTTASFEKLFGLEDLASLPSIDGFEATPQDVEELREKLHLAADKRQ